MELLNTILIGGYLKSDDYRLKNNCFFAIFHDPYSIKKKFCCQNKQYIVQRFLSRLSCVVSPQMLVKRTSDQKLNIWLEYYNSPKLDEGIGLNVSAFSIHYTGEHPKKLQ